MPNQEQEYDVVTKEPVPMLWKLLKKHAQHFRFMDLPSKLRVKIHALIPQMMVTRGAWHVAEIAVGVADGVEVDRTVVNGAKVEAMRDVSTPASS